MASNYVHAVATWRRRIAARWQPTIPTDWDFAAYGWPVSRSYHLPHNSLPAGGSSQFVVHVDTHWTPMLLPVGWLIVPEGPEKRKSRGERLRSRFEKGCCCHCCCTTNVRLYPGQFYRKVSYTRCLRKSMHMLEYVCATLWTFLFAPVILASNAVYPCATVRYIWFWQCYWPQITDISNIFARDSSTFFVRGSQF